MPYLMASAPLLRRSGRLRKLRDYNLYQAKKEVTWYINKAAAVDTAELRERCTRRFAQNARKNAKSLLNPEMTVRYIARIVFQSARTKVVKKRDFVSPFLLADPLKVAF